MEHKITHGTQGPGTNIKIKQITMRRSNNQSTKSVNVYLYSMYML